MERTELTERLERAEGLIYQGEAELAVELLARLAEDAEEYADRNCQATNEVQWFSFPSAFERLAYRRVEDDPRELRDVGEPFDRLYGDLALAQVHAGDYDAATEALRQAVRWNPMECSYRLNLADLYRVAGDMQEYLGLTFSVFARASDARHLARAFVNFAGWFRAQERPLSAAAALRAARTLDVRDGSIEASLDQARATDHDPDLVDDAQMAELLAEEGLPAGANAEVVVCLIVSAMSAAEEGDRSEAARLMLRARDLVGERALRDLVALVNRTKAAEGGDDATTEA